jgi:hypothetical protein
MRTLTCFAVAIGAIVVLSSPALAQRQPGRGFGNGQFGGIGSLIRNESVQKELKMEKDQVDKATEAARKIREKHAEEFAKLADLSQEERRTKSAELNRTVAAETLVAVSEVLKPEQVTRLKQIELQQAGVAAFTRADVEKALTLNDEQKTKLTAIADESSTKMRELRGGGQGGGRTRGTPDLAKVTALRKEMGDKALAVLTDDQKKSWQSMTGEVFTVVQPPPRKKDD